MRLGNAAGLHCDRDRFGVDRVVLSPMLTHADLPNSRGVEHSRLVSPLLQRVVDVPTLSAGLEADLGRSRLRSQPGGELRETSYRGAFDDLTIFDFAIGNVAHTQIQTYASHDRPSLGPLPSGILCL
jgi:hypothetical protein